MLQAQVTQDTTQRHVLKKVFPTAILILYLYFIEPKPSIIMFELVMK